MDTASRMFGTLTIGTSARPTRALSPPPYSSAATKVAVHSIVTPRSIPTSTIYADDRPFALFPRSRIWPSASSIHLSARQASDSPPADEALSKEWVPGVIVATVLFFVIICAAAALRFQHKSSRRWTGYTGWRKVRKSRRWLNIMLCCRKAPTTPTRPPLPLHDYFSPPEPGTTLHEDAEQPAEFGIRFHRMGGAHPPPRRPYLAPMPRPKLGPNYGAPLSALYTGPFVASMSGELVMPPRAHCAQREPNLEAGRAAAAMSASRGNGIPWQREQWERECNQVTQIDVPFRRGPYWFVRNTDGTTRVLSRA